MGLAMWKLQYKILWVVYVNMVYSEHTFLILRVTFLEVDPAILCNRFPKCRKIRKAVTDFSPNFNFLQLWSKMCMRKNSPKFWLSSGNDGKRSEPARQVLMTHHFFVPDLHLIFSLGGTLHKFLHDILCENAMIITELQKLLKVWQHVDYTAVST